jgi:hypothetical protein
MSFAHTRQRLVVSIGPPPGSHDWTIWSARMPKL